MSRPAEVEPKPASPPPAPPADQPQAPRREKARSWFRDHPFALLAILLFLALAVVAGLWAWGYYSVRESTDDARIDGHIGPVSTRVAGTVIEILVDENDKVTAGQVLARLDDRDYRVALHRAEADVAAQHAAASAARTRVPIASTSTTTGLSAAESGQAEAEASSAAANEAVGDAQARAAAAAANLRAAMASRDRTAKDVERYKVLIERDEISRQQFDTAVSAANAAQAQADSAAAAVSQARAGVQVAESQRRQAEARIEQAKSNVAAARSGPQQVAVSRAQAREQEATAGVREAALAQARLNLEYTVVRAPIAGLVGRRTVQLGQNVQPGQPLFSIVEIANLWVSAMFKETQLDKMRPGQSASVEVDAFGGAEMRGRVESIGAATGGTFSVLPAENASGNYVKVVQRVPVKIVFEPGQPLLERIRPGMSVVPTVLVQ
jgi:membrane fusion protein (multidrug efflux system)